MSLLCEDFESGVPPTLIPTGGGASTIKAVEGGRESKQAVSVTFQNGKEAALQRKLDGHPHVEMTIWIRADAAPTTPKIHFRVASLLFGAPCDWELSWQIWLEADGLFQGADSYDVDVNPSCGPVKFTYKPLLTAAEMFDGRWHRVVIDADASARIRKTTTTVDQKPSISEAIDSESGKVPNELQVDMGIPCVQETSGCYPWEGAPYTVYFDQVTLVAK